MTDIDRRSSSVRPLPLALLVTARPKQWVKNTLVFVAPLAAGVLTQSEEATASLLAFTAFCFAASGTYFLNDAGDAEADRLHPVKRRRPVAAGDLSVGVARGVGVGLLLCALVVSATVNVETVAVVAGYVALTTTYSLWLKHVPVFDMAAVAAGFMLRAIGGAVATEVPVSDWFFIVATAASFFIVAGKRLAELRTVGDDAAAHRPALGAYSTTYLRYVLAVASGIAILAYCLWAFEEAVLRPEGAVWLELSIIPFVLGLLRYALLIEAGEGGEPEELVLGDRPLQIMGVAWVIIFGIGIYVG
jgi:decaprenyl-phosphate phosphoribosyltransferase